MVDVQFPIPDEMLVVIAHEALRRAALLRVRQSQLVVEEIEAFYGPDCGEPDEASRRDHGEL
jgi:hypothetical protein